MVQSSAMGSAVRRLFDLDHSFCVLLQFHLVGGTSAISASFACAILLPPKQVDGCLAVYYVAW